MLALHFEGWFQCRLATNPDPTDEPRGVSGYTFALAGEPDFDRIIRLQNPLSPRSHGPQVGVLVTTVTVNGQTPVDHPLINARVDFLDEPKFESRNMLLTDDKAGVGLIHPFHLHISGEGVVLSRKDVLYPKNPDAKPHEVPVAILNRRGPTDLGGMRIDPIRIADATGINSPVEYRIQRKNKLEMDLRRTTDPEVTTALEKRLRELEITDISDMRLLALTAVQTRRFDMTGTVELTGQAERLGGTVDVSREWPIEFWMGAWDADALCGYMRGMLTVPFRRNGDSDARV